MSLEKGKGFKKEELVQELMELVFEKAQKESKKKPIHGLAKYLSDRFEESLQFNIDVNTFTRYYKGYISKEKEKQSPTDDVLNTLCQYLDHKDFKDFEIKSECEIVKRKLRKERTRLEEKYKKMISMSLVVGVLLLVTLSFFISKYYKKNCMIWVEDHYEKIRCSGLEDERKLDEVVFLKMREIKNPLQCEREMWYDKTDNKITFFTYHGEHPINGKTLKPVTERICEIYILKPRDSTEANTSLDSIE
ncbi:hypothetical protein LCL86_04570 [Muricauda ruestringensis]|uniref:hypothetical protein n=1 Tax=Flagellimonas ruestringensis TaxID=111501 RepID=UPI001CD79B10|nr:hypothetical protein [Allomuricauda ruestringensis]MCA0958303.1 hypothetical protein [Allomuricauda ruestringensis]